MITSASASKDRSIVGASPIYYGWIVLIVATLGVIATSPGQSFSVSLFIDSFIKDFGLSRTNVSALYSGGTFFASLSLAFIGRLVDRYGNRTMTVVIAALFAITLVMFSFVNGPVALFFGFLGIRMFGQGALGLVNNTVIVEWFKRLRGRVMSFVFVAFALFQWAYIPWLQRQIEVHDWRVMWVYLGVAVAVVVIPMAWLFMRNTPEEFGLVPDGDIVTESDDTTVEIEEDSWTLSEVLRNPTFWIFVFGRVISPAWGTGLIFHQISIFSELGHDASTAAATYAMITIVTAASSIVFGILVDRMRPSLVLVMQLSALIVSMLLAMFMTTQSLLWAYAVMFGIMQGGGGAIDGTVWVNLFGREHQASIRGFVSTTLVTGTAIGPVLFGLSIDMMGSYSPVLWMGIILSAMGVLGALFSPTPQHRKAKNA